MDRARHGLEIPGAVFQRIMKWVLRDLPGVNVYIDNVVVGSTGSIPEELLANHERDLRAVLGRLKEHDIHVSPKKAQLFVVENELCGHVMRDGQRRPSPGKFMAIQKLSLPETISHLYGFMGFTNYYSRYVPHYAELAALLTVG